MVARKPKSQRARQNADTIQQIELVFEPGEPPELPTIYVDPEGELHELKWSPLTTDWWNNWREAPQAAVFSQSDWQSLLTTAFVADKFFRTFEVKYAAELRQREAAFGATPLDRLRLRMSWREDQERGVKVSEAEEKRRAAAAKRYGDIRIVKDETA